MNQLVSWVDSSISLTNQPKILIDFQLLCVFFCAGSELVTPRSVPSLLPAWSALVVRDRPVRRGAHCGRVHRLDRPPVSASLKWPVHGRRVRPSSPAGVLRVFADRFWPDAPSAARIRPSNDGRPLLGHQLHGCRSHVFAQVTTRIEPRFSMDFYCILFFFSFLGAKYSVTLAKSYRTAKNIKTSAKKLNWIRLR